MIWQYQIVSYSIHIKISLQLYLNLYYPFSPFLTLSHLQLLTFSSTFYFSFFPTFISLFIYFISISISFTPHCHYLFLPLSIFSAPLCCYLFPFHSSRSVSLNSSISTSSTLLYQSLLLSLTYLIFHSDFLLQLFYLMTHYFEFFTQFCNLILSLDQTLKVTNTIYIPIKKYINEQKSIPK